MLRSRTRRREKHKYICPSTSRCTNTTKYIVVELVTVVVACHSVENFHFLFAEAKGKLFALQPKFGVSVCVAVLVNFPDFPSSAAGVLVLLLFASLCLSSSCLNLTIDSPSSSLLPSPPPCVIVLAHSTERTKRAQRKYPGIYIYLEIGRADARHSVSFHVYFGTRRTRCSPMPETILQFPFLGSFTLRSPLSQMVKSRMVSILHCSAGTPTTQSAKDKVFRHR